ncbi:MAG: hypothetical protein HC831_18965, partial [Chloroflexia bacterium]|nr:hypothetical protein [Chloroflexia bacterium]
IYDRKVMPYFTNFYKFSSGEGDALKMNGKKLEEEIEFINPRKIICLGNEVMKAISQTIPESLIHASNGRGLTLVPHPGYVKRFAGKEGKEKYIKELKQTLI